MAGRYRVIALLGAGGFGVAYRAWDLQTGVPVVLKQPLAEHTGNPDVLARFDREINRLCELEHPHIVPIRDHGHDSCGRPYLAMRFLPAGSLADRGKPQPLSHLHHWLPAVAAALDFVHARGIVHRDIKPANIFFDTHTVAYLGDFGIAKIIDDELAEASEHSLTSTGGEIGTYPYMAPELFRKPRILSGAYDQYALAVTVYEMVCGRRPFSGDSGQLIFAHATQEPPDIRQVCVDAPKSLCEAVIRALAKKPVERFGTCSAFAQAALYDIPVVPVSDLVRNFLCPGCQRLVSVPAEHGGRTGQCSACGVALRISGNLDALWLTHEAPPSTSTRTSRPKTIADTLSKPRQSRSSRIHRLVVLWSVLLAVAGTGLWALSTWEWSRSRSIEQPLLEDIGRSMSSVGDELATPDSLIDDAQRMIAAAPPDISGALSALAIAERSGAKPSRISGVRAEAYAARAATHVANDCLAEAVDDFQAARSLGANPRSLTRVRQAVAAACRHRAKQALIRIDSAGLKVATDTLLRLGESPSAIAFIWREYGDACVERLDSDGLSVACLEGGRVGVSPAAALTWWLRYAEACTDKLDQDSLATALSEARKHGLTDLAVADLWLRYGDIASKPPWESAIAVQTAVNHLVLVAPSTRYDRVARLQQQGILLQVRDARILAEQGNDQTAAAAITVLSERDSRIVCAALNEPSNKILRETATKQYRRLFSASMGANDWENAARYAQVAGDIDRTSWKWCAATLATRLNGLTRMPEDAIKRLPPQVIAELPADVISGLPVAQLVPLRNSVGMYLRLIPPGVFVMGEKDSQIEKPHRVTLTRPFYIGIHEVTNAHWKAVIGDLPRATRGDLPGDWESDEQPVGLVTWDAAGLFCKTLSELPDERAAGRAYRLPTEAEWEYACRAGTTTRFSCGDGDKVLEDHAWFNANSGKKVHPVGHKQPNPWGLHDMHGNLFEWCSDWYGDYSDAALTDPTGPSGGSRRAYRGGCWLHGASTCLSARRYWAAPMELNQFLGFRVALSIPVSTESVQRPLTEH